MLITIMIFSILTTFLLLAACGALNQVKEAVEQNTRQARLLANRASKGPIFNVTAKDETGHRVAERIARELEEDL